MARHDNGFVGKREQSVVKRAQDLLHGAAGEISAADGSSEESVAGDQLFLGREIEADAAFGVTGRVQDLCGVCTGRDRLPGSDALIDFNLAGCWHADPVSLRIEHVQQSVVILIEQNGGASSGAELHGSANVVDVGVSDHDLLHRQVVFADCFENVVDVVARIDHHRLARGLVADDRAVALQRADREDFVDHPFIL